MVALIWLLTGRGLSLIDLSPLWVWPDALWLACWCGWPACRACLPSGSGLTLCGWLSLGSARLPLFITIRSRICDTFLNTLRRLVNSILFDFGLEFAWRARVLVKSRFMWGCRFRQPT